MRTISIFVVVMVMCALLASISIVDAQLGTLTAPDSREPRQPQDPIVGLLTQPNLHTWEQPCPSYVQQTYVEWLAQAGIRSMPLHYDELNWEKQKGILDQLNGVLFTGGMQNTTVDSPFYTMSAKITQYALDRNSVGDKFVLWGTCQGFQLISMAVAADQGGVMRCDYNGTMTSMLPLEMVQPAANRSRWLSNVNSDDTPRSVFNDMTTKATTANGHNCGITPTTFSTNKLLKQHFNVLSTNVDLAGLPFVSTVEHKTAEIYGVQWHPEGAQFWFNMGFNKWPSTSRVSTYTANFLAERLRRNNRSFPSPTEGASHLISHWDIHHKPSLQYTGYYCLGVPVIGELHATLQIWWGVAICAVFLLLATWTYLYMKSRAVHPGGARRTTTTILNENTIGSESLAPYRITGGDECEGAAAVSRRSSSSRRRKVVGENSSFSTPPTFATADYTNLSPCNDGTPGESPKNV